VIYGLLGKSLSHSISPRVHHLFGNAEYQLFETDDPFRWLKTHSFQGINITIPYKTTLLSVLDDVDSIVQKTGSLNCIVNRNGRLAGYNTDVDGFKQTLIHHQVAVQDKMVVLLGNGGAARSVRQAFLDLGAKKVVKLCRRILEKEEYLLSEAASFQAADILVNTTPIGMYPNNDTGPLLSLDNFPAAEVVIDLIYNPLKTSFLQRASELGKKTINGLYLLVAQAKKAHELFLNTTLADDDVTRVYQQVNQELSNVIFVGLPLSGKSLYGKKLSEITHRTLIDTDDLIENTTKMTIPEIFSCVGEAGFRQKEFEAVSSFYQQHGLIVSTGGGVILNDELVRRLKQNGVIIYLDKDPQAIAARKIHNRPLLQDATNIFRLADTRKPLYQKAADIQIKIHPNRHDQLSEIEEKLNEYFSH